MIEWKKHTYTVTWAFPGGCANRPLNAKAKIRWRNMTKTKWMANVHVMRIEWKRTPVESELSRSKWLRNLASNYALQYDATRCDAFGIEPDASRTEKTRDNGKRLSKSKDNARAAISINRKWGQRPTCEKRLFVYFLLKQTTCAMWTMIVWFIRRTDKTIMWSEPSVERWSESQRESEMIVVGCGGNRWRRKAKVRARNMNLHMQIGQMKHEMRVQTQVTSGEMAWLTRTKERRKPKSAEWI